MNDFLIQDGVLVKCKCNLSQALISSEVTEIGVEAFSNITKLKTIQFTDKLVKISEKAFSNCYLLQEVVLPHSTVTIEDGAFINCVCLSEASVNSIKQINPNAIVEESKEE